jgi:hypothetical protein
LYLHSLSVSELLEHRRKCLLDLSYNDFKRGKILNLMRCPKGEFGATIRNANDVLMKFIGSPTTCIVLWDIAYIGRLL